jgi:hypothetical protein
MTKEASRDGSSASEKGGLAKVGLVGQTDVFCGMGWMRKVSSMADGVLFVGLTPTRLQRTRTTDELAIQPRNSSEYLRALRSALCTHSHRTKFKCTFKLQSDVLSSTAAPSGLSIFRDLCLNSMGSFLLLRLERRCGGFGSAAGC